MVSCLRAIRFTASISEFVFLSRILRGLLVLREKHLKSIMKEILTFKLEELLLSLRRQRFLRFHTHQRILLAKQGL